MGATCSIPTVVDRETISPSHRWRVTQQTGSTTTSSTEVSHLRLSIPLPQAIIQDAVPVAITRRWRVAAHDSPRRVSTTTVFPAIPDPECPTSLISLTVDQSQDYLLPSSPRRTVNVTSSSPLPLETCCSESISPQAGAQRHTSDVVSQLSLTSGSPQMTFGRPATFVPRMMNSTNTTTVSTTIASNAHKLMSGSSFETSASDYFSPTGRLPVVLSVDESVSSAEFRTFPVGGVCDAWSRGPGSGNQAMWIGHKLHQGIAQDGLFYEGEPIYVRPGLARRVTSPFEAISRPKDHSLNNECATPADLALDGPSLVVEHFTVE